jgi:hypothetical protein
MEKIAGLIIILGLFLIVYDKLDKHIKSNPSFEKLDTYQEKKDRGKTLPFSTPIKSDSIVEIKLNGDAEQEYKVSLSKIITTHEGGKARTFDIPTGEEKAITGNGKWSIQLNTNTKYCFIVLANPLDDSVPIPDIEYHIIEYKQPNDKIFIMGSTLLGIGIGTLIQG